MKVDFWLLKNMKNMLCHICCARTTCCTGSSGTEAVTPAAKGLSQMPIFWAM